jgi:hypothetical protein
MGYNGRRHDRMSTGMRWKKFFYRIIPAVLLLFFGLQLVSQAFFIIGERKPGSRGLPYLKLSSLCFPIDAVPLCEYGFVLLKNQQQSPVTPGTADTGGTSHELQASIDYLKKSLHVNMFYYRGHFYLGNAYLLENTADPTRLDLALEAFKRAARIRGNQARLSMDTMNLLLSLWPFLREEDKVFCSGLLDRSIKRLTLGDFNSLLETWGLYAQDVNFFKDVLKKRPAFYLAATQKLLHLNIYLEKRQELLSYFGGYKLTGFQEQYRQFLAKPSPDLPEKLKRLFLTLTTEPSIPYYLLRPADKFDRRNYFDFKKRLNLHILELLFSKKGWQKDTRQRSELRTFILSYIDSLSSMEELNAFYDFLEHKKYFELSASAFEVFYIEQLLKFKSGQNDTVISEIEDLRQSVAYVKTGHLDDYSDILLLLADVYISSGMLIQAVGVLDEIEITAANLTEVYWRKMRIESVIGPEDEKGKEEKIIEQKRSQYELIRNSSRVESSSRSVERVLYLTDNHEIEIQLGDSLKKSNESFYLLQVFIDGGLFYEAYMGRLTFPVRISLPPEEKYSRHTLSIKIL